jgi:hypothetical protein
MIITDRFPQELIHVCRGCPKFILKKKTAGLYRTAEWPTEMQPYCDMYHLHIEWVAAVLMKGDKTVRSDGNVGEWQFSDICPNREDFVDA